VGRRGIVVLVLLSVAACAQPEAVTTANVPGRAHPVAVDLPGSTSPTTTAPTGAPTTGPAATVPATPKPPAGSPSAEKPPAAPAEQAPLPGPYRQIASALNGNCLDLDAAGKGDGVAVIQWKCDDEPQNRWGWAGGYGTDIYKIVSQHSGKCVDVSGASTSDGARVVQMPCRDSGGSQLWRRTWFAKNDGWNYWRLQNVHSELCLDVPEESKEWGQYLWQYTCHQGAAQQFRTPA
jgi:Ricin-type beta-trefoil lectin domain-like